MKRCAVPGCGKESWSNNVCAMHRWRLANHGGYDLPQKPARPEFSVERLRSLLSYNRETGSLAWVGDVRNGVSAGDVAGHVDRSGYRRIVIDGALYAAHRLAWLHVHGEWPKGQVDHINGNRDDNRFVNLRDVSNSVNAQNKRGARKDNVTGLLGVSRRPHGYEARITLEGKTRWLGLFDSAEEAHAAYLREKREIHEGCSI
jgi:hypothetical protein